MVINRRWIPFLGVLFGTAANMLMQTVVATLLPQIVSELGGQQYYSWVFSGYLLVSTITIPFFAKLADSYGYKLIFISGMTIFLVGSLLSGMAPSVPFLVLARVIQGIGTGAVGPVTIALISFLFPIEKRGNAMGLYAGTQILSNVAGPILGGVIAETIGWQWSFYIVIPVGLISILLILFVPRANHRKDQTPINRMDILGSLLLGCSVAVLIQGFSQLGNKGIEAFPIIEIMLAVVLFVLFVFQEKQHQDPVISLALIQIKDVRLASISAFLIGILQYGAIAVLPMYALEALGSNPVDSAKLLIPFMVGMGVGVIVGGGIIKKVPYKVLAQVGWLLSFISLCVMLTLNLSGVFNFLIYVAVFTTSYGLGMLMPTFLLPAQNAVSSEQQAVVGGLIQLSRNSGGAIGIPILTTLLYIVKQAHSQNGGGYWIVFGFLAICALIGWSVGARFTGSVQDASRTNN